jgi:hypothetical protein
MWTMDLRILRDPSQSSIYRGRVALDPLVQRLGTPGNLRCGVSISSEAQVTRVVDSRMLRDFS